MQQLQLSTIGLPIGSLDAFIYQANQIPMLTLEEEQACATRLQKEGDLDSARRLVLAHLRYVIRVARGYLGYGLPLADLIQEGNIGLMKAVKRFDPTMGVRLVSFAVHWIKAEIHEFIIRNWRIVKVATTKAQRKLFFKLRSQKVRLGWFGDDEVTAVARDLGVSKAEVLRMEQRLNACDLAFDMPAHDVDDHALVPQDYLSDPHADPAYLLECERGETHDREQLQAAFEQLDERSRAILKARWLDDEKATLHDLAATYQVSAERIRQLEKNAFHKLKRHMEASY